ncbi:hypothetical protein [Litorivivens sp.]|uniref:hypothetical protein n=1 Tax=Litorivivens sp. TaxID=2020868 RepID=UPI0035693FDA
MSEALYDIIITGKLLDGVGPELAAQRVAQLFKTSPEKAAQLVDGKPHRIKKAVQGEAARKFKAALTKAGLQTIAKPVTSSDTTGSAGSTEAPATPSPATVGNSAQETATGSLDLAPEGTPVLRDEERPEVEEVEVDLSGIALADPEPWQGSANTSAPIIEPPDFGLAPPGVEIETLPDNRQKLAPDTSKLTLDEPGAQLGQAGPPPPPAPDTSHIKLEELNPFT